MLQPTSTLSFLVPKRYNVEIESLFASKCATLEPTEQAETAREWSIEWTQYKMVFWVQDNQRTKVVVQIEISGIPSSKAWVVNKQMRASEGNGKKRGKRERARV